MILYVNGCSHTAGHCVDVKKTYPYIVAASIFGINNYEVIDYVNPNQRLSFYSYKKHILSKIKKNKNYLIFQPDFGKSNDLIFFETYNFIHESIQNSIKIDYCIIQWSGPNRNILNIPCNDNGVIIDGITPHDNENMGLKFEPFASTQTLQYIKVLQDLLNKNDVNYSFIPYMELDDDVFKNYHLSKFIDLEKFTTNPKIGHRNYFRKRGWVCDSHGHPSDYANFYLSTKVMDIFNIENTIGLFDYYLSNNLNYNWRTNSQDIKFIKRNYDKLGDATKKIIKRLKKNLI